MAPASGVLSDREDARCVIQREGPLLQHSPLGDVVQENAVRKFLEHLGPDPEVTLWSPCNRLDILPQFGQWDSWAAATNVEGGRRRAVRTRPPRVDSGAVAPRLLLTPRVWVFGVRPLRDNAQ